MSAKSFPKRPVIVLSFIIFAMIIASTGNFDFTGKAETEPQTAVLVPTITADNNDTLFTDVDVDGRVDPGDVIQYTVTINNTGTDATAVQFNETLDINTTLVAGSLNASPIGFDDSFAATGNVQITVAVANSVLNNDIDPNTGNNTGLTASAGATSAQGGNVAMNADGSFSYNPPPGFEGADTFTYTVTDGAGATGSGTVTMNVSGMIWFINNGASACTTLAAGCGRLTNPFSSLAAFQALNNGTGNNPASNDNIFVFESATAYTGGVTLLAGQKFIGQDATATLSAITGITPPAGSDALPAMNTGGNATTIQNAGGNGVTLNSGNTLRGFTGSNSSASSISGTNFGTVTIADVIINTSGQALSLTTGTLAGAGFTLLFSSGGTNNVALTGVSGIMPAVSGALTGATGTAFLVSGGTCTITYNGNISHSSNSRVITIDGGHATGTITFGGNLTVTNGTGISLDNADGTYNFTGTNSLNAANAGIDVVNGSSGTITFGTGTSVTTTGDFSYNENTSTATVNYNGTITKTTSSTGINIVSKTGGTTTFNGAVNINSPGATGINLTSNAGGTINFTGGLTVSSTTQTAFNATGGGTISATQNNTSIVNTLTTTTGTALNVVSTNIGADGLTFRSINKNGGTNGIVLNTTGTAGSLTVTGNSSGLCGGQITVQPVGTANTVTAPNTADCTGGTIQNTTGDAISLVNTANVSLTRMRILNGANRGIFADDVTNFALVHSFLDNNGDDVNANPDDNNIHFLELLGTCAITNSTIQGSDGDEIRFNPSSGTLTSLAVSGTFIGNDANDNTSTCNGCDRGNGFTVNTLGTSVVNVSITNSVFNNVFSANFLVTGEGTSSRTTSVTNTSFIDPIADTGNVPPDNIPQDFGGVAISIQGSFSSDNNFTISNNTFLGIDSNAINISFGTLSTTSADNLGTISGNVIGNAAQSDSGSRQAIGIAMESQGDADTVVFVTNNTTHHTDQQGFFAQSRLGNGASPGEGRFDLILRDNNFGVMDDNTAFPFFFLHGATIDSRNTTTLCLDSASNNASTVGGAERFMLRNRDTSFFILERFDDGDGNFNETITNTTIVQNFHNGQNDAGTTTLATLTGTFRGFNEAPDNTCRNAPTVSFAGDGGIGERDEVFANPELLGDEFENSDVRVVMSDEQEIRTPRPQPKPRIKTPVSRKNIENSNDNISFLNSSYQTPSEMLATLEPFVKSPANAKTTSTESIVAQADVIETPETNNLNFVNELAGKFIEAISPTVYSQETAKTETENIAGETVTVNGAGAGFTLPAGKSVTITFRATVNNTPVGLTQVSTQGTVTASGGINVPTNDPATGTPNDATVTLIDSTTIAVSSSQNPSLTGQSVTFTATLTGAPVHATGDPSGTVEFFEDGNSLGTAAVNAGAANDNTGTATLAVSNLPAGTHAITATFSGGGGYNANNTSNTINQTVGNTAVWDGSASADWNTAANWTTNGVPSLATHDISIPAAGVTNNPTISASDVSVNNLTLSAGRTLTINSNRTLNIAGVLTMNGNNIDATNGVLALGTGATITRTSGSVLGNFDKSFAATGAFVYPVGTATGHSPVNVNITALAVNPSTLRVRANDGTAAGMPVLVDATTLDRFWSLTETGDLTANVVFNYLEADVDGNENNYRTIRITGGATLSIANGSPCPGAGSPCVDAGANTITVNNLSVFSDWTAGELAPTAANVLVVGRVLTADGRAISNARLAMIDQQGNVRQARSNPFGYYRFEDVEAGAAYTFDITHKQYQFTPQIITINEDLQELNFMAIP